MSLLRDLSTFFGIHQSPESKDGSPVCVNVKGSVTLIYKASLTSLQPLKDRTIKIRLYSPTLTILSNRSIKTVIT